MTSGNLQNTDPAFDRPSAREAFRIIRHLVDAGFEAYLAGGCVRDALLGRTPKDFDVATNATPESVRELFGYRKTLAFGASFGVIGVLPPTATKSEKPEPTEVATFRSDGTYSDGRRPDSVEFGSAEEDTLRRDFTINGLFYDPVQESVIDFVDGLADLDRKRIRTIGAAKDRFAEDKLRMLRAIRFSTVLGFDIESTTMTAIQHAAASIHCVSGERIGAEMRRVIASPNVAVGVRALRKSRLQNEIFPLLARSDSTNLDQLLSRLDDHRFEVAMAFILNSVGGSPEDVRALTDRWKLTNEESRRISMALRCCETLCTANQSPWSVVQPLLVDRDIEYSVALTRALVRARGIPADGLDIVSDALTWPAETLDPVPLLTGDDLRSLGIQPGPIYKQILKRVRDDQLDGRISDRDQARELAIKMASV